MDDGSGCQERLAASFGLLQLYNPSTFVIVSKTTVEQAMQSEADAAAHRPHRWPIFLAAVVDTIQKLSQAALQPFRQQPEALLRRALQGNADAQYELARLLEVGNSAVPKDSELAKIWLKRASQKRQPDAMRHLSNGNQRSLIDAPSEQLSKSFSWKLFLDPFTKLWPDWQRHMTLKFLFAKFRPSISKRTNLQMPYLLDCDYDDDDDDDF